MPSLIVAPPPSLARDQLRNMAIKSPATTLFNVTTLDAAVALCTNSIILGAAGDGEAEADGEMEEDTEVEGEMEVEGEIEEDGEIDADSLALGESDVLGDRD